MVEPQRVGGAHGARPIVRLRQGQRRLLMRQGHVGACIASSRKRLDEIGEFFRRHFLAPVFASDAVMLEPIIMNERRSRMLDWPADDAGRASGRDHASATTELRRTPMDGHSTSIVSPGFSQIGGSAFATFLIGVPVQMMSPALSVMKLVV